MQFHNSCEAALIDREEIDAKSEEFEIHSTNVQRDYVFGWLLFAIFENSYLKDLLVLKGGNCFRKAYFPNTRFSSDLDFSTQSALDVERVIAELEQCCGVAQEKSGIQFITDRTSFAESQRANLGRNDDRKIYKGKIFFQDFYGQKSTLQISVRMDVTEFDQLFLPISEVPLIHPYSDADTCQAELKCVAVEEGIASKLKCLLQRRHSHDLYDLVYAAFFNDSIDLNRSEIASVFLRKTIFSGSPGSAKQILLGLPMPFFRAAWDKYIVCPVHSKIGFDEAEGVYASFIDSIFASSGMIDRVSDAFFPAELRNLFLEAGAGQHLMEITYDNITRTVEPYALSYKRRTDGIAREYLYVWDRSGGSSGRPGLRSLVNPKVCNPRVLEETFKPRFEVELSKSGEKAESSYFGGNSRPRSRALSVRRGRSAYSGGPRHVVDCPYCGKRFKRKTSTTSLKPHKDKTGWPCSGRSGIFVGWE